METESAEETKWTSRSTRLLLSLYKDKKDHFRDKKQKKKNIWKGMFEEIEAHGIKGLNVEKVERKFRNMKQTFEKIRDKNRYMGLKSSKWEYYAEMEEIFADDLTNSECQTSSSFVTSDEDNEEKHMVLDSVLEQAMWEDGEEPVLSNVSSHFVLSGNPFDTPMTSSKRKASSPASSAKKKPTASAEKQSCSQTDKLIEVEERRTDTLAAIRVVMEESNRIQAERNQLLKKYLSIMCANKKYY